MIKIPSKQDVSGHSIKRKTGKKFFWYIFLNQKLNIKKLKKDARNSYEKKTSMGHTLNLGQMFRFVCKASKEMLLRYETQTPFQRSKSGEPFKSFG